MILSLRDDFLPCFLVLIRQPIQYHSNAEVVGSKYALCRLIKYQIRFFYHIRFKLIRQKNKINAAGHYGVKFGFQPFLRIFGGEAVGPQRRCVKSGVGVALRIPGVSIFHRMLDSDPKYIPTRADSNGS